VSGRGIADMPCLSDEWRVDLHSRGFESPEAAHSEDAEQRAPRLRRWAAEHKGNASTRAMALADRLDPAVTPEIPKTPASARYVREQRIRIISHVWKAVAEDQTGTIARYDVIKPGWACSSRGLGKKSPFKLNREFRRELERAAAKVVEGGSSNCRGFLFAVLHGDFEKRSKLFQPHWHLVATGDWVPVVEHLRTVKAYQPTERVRTPIRARRKFDDLAYALTYLMKLYWPSKWQGKVSGQKTERRSRKPQRIPEPHHSRLLLWMDRWSIQDLVLTMNVRVGKSGLVVKSVFE
jgi:hypothetical protein